MYNLEDTIHYNNSFALTYDNEKNLNHCFKSNGKNSLLYKTPVEKTNNGLKTCDKSLYDNVTDNKNVKEKNKPVYDIKETTVKLHIKSLLWIIYVMIHGEEEYKILEKKQYFNKEQDLRYSLIENIQKMSDKKKQYLKAHKIKLQTIISDLGNNHQLTIDSFIGLCMILNINVCLVKNKIAQVLMNNVKSDDIWCIDVNKQLLSSQLTNMKFCEKKYYLVENIIKPFKGISSYKIKELQDICLCLNIKTSMSNGKKMTKKVLYQELLDKIEI